MLRTFLGLAAATLAAGCTVVGIRSGTEEPPHAVLATLEDGVEVRRYAPRLAAETLVPAGPEARNAAFRKLAGYIFGGNQGARKIAMTVPVETREPGQRLAMTAPVAVDATGDAVRMRFFLPADLTLATAPLPNDAAVALVEIPAETLAVRRFTGSTGAAAVARETARLLQVLDGSPWRPVGDPVAFFYDPPWTLPPLRRNEVVVPVEPSG